MQEQGFHSLWRLPLVQGTVIHPELTTRHAVGVIRNVAVLRPGRRLSLLLFIGDVLLRSVQRQLSRVNEESSFCKLLMIHHSDLHGNHIAALARRHFLLQGLWQGGQARRAHGGRTGQGPRPPRTHRRTPGIWLRRLRRVQDLSHQQRFCFCRCRFGARGGGGVLHTPFNGLSGRNHLGGPAKTLGGCAHAQPCRLTCRDSNRGLIMPSQTSQISVMLTPPHQRHPCPTSASSWSDCGPMMGQSYRGGWARAPPTGPLPRCFPDPVGR